MQDVGRARYEKDPETKRARKYDADPGSKRDPEEHGTKKAQNPSGMNATLIMLKQEQLKGLNILGLI